MENNIIGQLEVNKDYKTLQILNNKNRVESQGYGSQAQHRPGKGEFLSINPRYQKTSKKANKQTKQLSRKTGWKSMLIVNLRSNFLSIYYFT